MCLSRLPAYGRTERISIGSMASRSAARASSASSSEERAPFQATRTPPSASSGEASSASVARLPDGAGRNRLVGLAPLARRPVLGALADDGGVGESHPFDRLAEELALAPHRLDQVETRAREAGREHQAG